MILDVRACVKSYAAEKSRERSEGKKIRVAIPDDVPVSAGGSYSASSDPDGGGGDLVSISPLHFNATSTKKLDCFVAKKI